MRLAKPVFRLLISALTAAAVSSSFVSAQQPTLRDVAERGDFLIGAAIDRWHIAEDERVLEVTAREFNLFVPSNDAKWCFIHPEEDRYDFEAFDAQVDFAEENDMVIRGHTLVWHGCFPTYLEGRDLTREEAIEHMREHITTVVSRYKGRIAYWDVVNEAFEADGTRRQSPWQQWIGDDYIALAFQFAHEADPDAKLLYNDFDIETRNPKSNGVYDALQRMLLDGVPIHALGIQTHVQVGSVGEGKLIDTVSFDQNIRRFGQLGLEVQITEMDAQHPGEPTEGVLLQQAGDYYEVLQTCLKSKFCNGFTTWGVSDKNSWYRMPEFSNNPLNAPLMFDDNFEPKPAYYAVLDLLSRRAGDNGVLTDAEIAAMLADPEVARGEVPQPARSNADQLAPDPVNGVAFYAPFPVEIALDGEIDDWENIPRDTMSRVVLRPDGDSTGMQFAVAADEENIYFLAEVRDSKLVYGDRNPASEWYQEDSVEFYINATGNLNLTAYQRGIVQIGISAANIGNTGDALVGGGRVTDVPVQVVAVETENGYIIEAAVPLKTNVWDIQPEHEARIGFQTHLNGSAATERDTKLIWSSYDTGDNSWRDPSLFGELIFWDVNE
jgi:endo-1,4-beta-xylanase